MEYYIALDGGTSNTRLRLISDEGVVSVKKLPIGAGSAGGREKWCAAICDAAHSLLEENGLKREEIRAMIGAGMITSEYGLCPLTHLAAPAGIAELAAGMKEVEIAGLEIPCFFIPGVKQVGDHAEGSDMMRGEEAEVIGLLPYAGRDAVYVLPGTHAKHVFVDGEGRISSFKTFMTGEMIGAIAGGTILRDAVDLSVEDFDRDALIRGCDFAAQEGMLAALFKVRIMKNLFAADKKACYSFFLGALLSDEIRSLRKYGKKCVLVAGKPSLRFATEFLLRHGSAAELVTCPEVAIENASAMGVIEIYKYAEKVKCLK